MGRVINFPGHHRRRCPAPETCEGCFLCRGGLYCCTRCGGAEASLPTHCPGERMSMADMDAVQAGTVDYDVRRGGWIAGPNWSATEGG